MRIQNTPRDKDYVTAHIDGVSVVVSPENFTVAVKGISYTLFRSTVNRLVDWYIGTDAIRAALKAKDEEIERLENLILDVRNLVKNEHEYGPTGAAITRSERRRGDPTWL